jgi:4-hydroxy-3-polyprenylbenzoate decarboxylase
MSYYRDLHEWLDVLDAKGYLHRVQRRINKDTEMHPLVRLQFRGLPERERKGWFFDNIVDVRGKSYDIPVALAVMAPSRAVYALGMGVESPQEIPAKWAAAQTRPVEPRMVSSARCQEIALTGAELEKAGGLGMLPVPISTPGFDSGPFFSSGHWVTKDPETGDYNFGTYRGQIKSPTRVGLFAFAYQDVSQHWNKARARRMPLEAAIVIGCTPNLSYCSTARLSPGAEYAVAGAIAGEPMELVRCKTVDLMVPAQSEIVIEGVIPTEEVEPEGPFGEFTGYMAHRALDKFMNVTCITRRSDAVFQAFLSQFPPSESSILRGVGLEGLIYKILTVDKKMKGILEVALPDAAGSHGVGIIRMDRAAVGDPMTALNIVADMPRAAPKILIAVDEDIDARDAEAVQWAMAYRMQPHRDIQIRDIKVSTALDFSLAPPSSREAVESVRGSAILIDATRKWEYPPVSLPRREFMENAQAIWRELKLPPLQLKQPWFGYNLGSWSEEDQADAERALRGEHYAVGDARRVQRVPTKD